MATNHSLEEDASLLLEQIGSSSSLLDDDGISNQALHSCSGCGSSVCVTFVVEFCLLL